MALEYTLSIEVTLSRTVLTKRLLNIGIFKESSYGELASNELLVHIGEPGEIESKVVEAEFGFTPSASIIFRVNKESDPVRSRAHVVRSCMAILETSFNHQAVLLFNGETIIFLVKNNSLSLNPVEGFWSEEVLLGVSQPYIFEAIDSI